MDGEGEQRREGGDAKMRSEGIVPRPGAAAGL